MSFRLPKRRLNRGAAAAVAAAIAAAGMAVSATGASAAIRPLDRVDAALGSPQAASVLNPYSPAYHHAYRHGVVPTRSRYQRMRQWVRAHPRAAAAAAAPSDLNYGGGIDGIGVTTGHEKVYLVFYGSQWGTQRTNYNRDVTLSGDPSGVAPYLQQFFRGLGTGDEVWSGVMTQYCQGVAAGAQSCPASNTRHVAYPAGGALSGVWVDESAPSPVQADGNELGVEAVNAAAHFGNTTAASNRNAQYVILSPTGTDPDQWQENGFCAWHDDTADSALTGGAVSSPYGDIAFTNLPYVTDAVAGCGRGFVNSIGVLDGVSIVEGHEYAETITDQNPAGGWTDSSSAENGDKCAWITPGTPGGAFDLTTGTGTFAVQTTWANDGAGGSGACEGSHPVVTDPGRNTVTVTSPGNQAGKVGSAASLQIHASDSASGQTLAYHATGLPGGLLINSATGLITGTPSRAGRFTVVVKVLDKTGAAGSAGFAWAITTSGAGCTAAQLIGDPGFENGTNPPFLAPWTATLLWAPDTNDPQEPTHSGSWDALFNTEAGYPQQLAQTVTIPSACKTAEFSFWLHIDTTSVNTVPAQDTFNVQVLDASSGTVLATLHTFSGLDAGNGFTQHFYDLSPYIGWTITLRFTTQETSQFETSFVDDDNALKVS